MSMSISPSSVTPPPPFPLFIGFLTPRKLSVPPFVLWSYRRTDSGPHLANREQYVCMCESVCACLCEWQWCFVSCILLTIELFRDYLRQQGLLFKVEVWQLADMHYSYTHTHTVAFCYIESVSDNIITCMLHHLLRFCHPWQSLLLGMLGA